jgi:predicted RNA-binding protein with PUA-like domain
MPDPARQNSWLIKTEPSTYSFDRLVEEGRTVWDGIRNNLALMHLRAMRAGDAVLVYHSGSEKAVVGRARITRPAFQEPGQSDPRFVAVEVEAVAPLTVPVTLGTLKGDPSLAGLPLIRNSRLSVMPVSPAEWEAILAHGKG